MTKLFLKLYSVFSKHRTVLAIILGLTTIIFAFFASKIHLEENIAALLPQTDKSNECAVAFGNIKLKDKVFLELHSCSDSIPAERLTEQMDAFMSILSENDEENLIDNCLYKFDTDDLMNAIYYGISALPCHLGEDFYSAVDTLLNDKYISMLSSGDVPVSLLGDDPLPYCIVNAHLLSRDSTTAIAYLTPAFNTLDTKAGSKLERLFVRCIREYQKHYEDDVEILYHGASPEGTFNAGQIKKDLVLSIGISLFLICLLICISFKSWRAILHIILPVVYGTLFSLACIYWIKGEMSLIAIGIGAIVLGVAVSYCLHLLTHLKYCEDVETAIREESRPICLGCLTTIGAFAGLILTSSTLLSDFGIFASFALVGTTLFVLIFLPHFLTPKDCEKNEKAFRIINKINSYPIDRNKIVVGLLVLVSAVSICFSGKVKFDNDLANIGYREPKIVKSESLYNEKINSGFYNMSYAAYASDLDSAVIYMRGLYSKLDELKKDSLIHSYSSLEGVLIPLEEQQSNIDRWTKYWTKERTEKTYKLLRDAAIRQNWETGEFDVPETFKMMAEADYEPQLIYDAGIIPEALLCNYVELSKDGWLVFTNVLLEKKNLKKVNDIVASQQNIVVLDPFYYTGDMVEIVHNDFNVVLLISSIFVFVVLLLSYRSLTISIIAFLPMMLSWYIVQGMMAIFGIEFNLINIMISSFIFGIGVDYSIFVMDGLINRAKFQSYRLLLCHKSAIFFSATTLLAVTGSLLFAVHPAIHSIGISTIIGMTSTILITYAIQPVLFKLAMKSNFLRRVALHEKKK